MDGRQNLSLAYLEQNMDVLGVAMADSIADAFLDHAIKGRDVITLQVGIDLAPESALDFEVESVP